MNIFTVLGTKKITVALLVVLTALRWKLGKVAWKYLQGKKGKISHGNTFPFSICNDVLILKIEKCFCKAIPNPDSNVLTHYTQVGCNGHLLSFTSQKGMEFCICYYSQVTCLINFIFFNDLLNLFFQVKIQFPLLKKRTRRR